MLNKLNLTVITDTHYYSPSIGTSGKAYNDALMRSQKLLNGSKELLEAAFKKIANDTSSDIVLISGDLTNDGEVASHYEFREMLRDLKSKGKRIYVIAASHDYNKKCKKYVGDNIEYVDGFPEKEFYEFYKEFGPDDAISSKPEFLSYVVQLNENVRLFALDDDHAIDGEMLKWLKEQSEDARRNDQFIIAMTHHPIIPASPMYELIGKGDMHREYKERRKQYADMGIQFMLTGHSHTHNIGRIFSERGNAFYAISTASAVGYPAPIRKLTIDLANKLVSTTTDLVDEADIDTGDLTLSEFLNNRMIGVIANMLKAAGGDTEKFAYMAQAISIKPSLVYKFGWVVKPIFKWLNRVKFDTFAKWTKKETGLNKEDWKEIKDDKIIDFIIQLVSNLFSGENNLTADDPKCRIYVGFLRIIDSILEALHIDLQKIVKVAPDATHLLAPLALKSEFDAYTAQMPIFDYVPQGEIREAQPSENPFDKFPKSKKGKGIIGVALLCAIPLFILLILPLIFGFIKNSIKYRKKIKSHAN